MPLTDVLRCGAKSECEESLLSDDDDDENCATRLVVESSVVLREESNELRMILEGANIAVLDLLIS